MLPHEYPFRFVDSEAGGDSLSVLVTGNGTWSRGEPGPELLAVEILAQAAAVLLPRMGGKEGNLEGALAGVSDLRLDPGCLLPGAKLVARVELEGRYGSLIRVAGRLEDGDRTPVEGRLLLSVTSA